MEKTVCVQSVLTRDQPLLDFSLHLQFISRQTILFLVSQAELPICIVRTEAVYQSSLAFGGPWFWRCPLVMS